MDFFDAVALYIMAALLGVCFVGILLAGISLIFGISIP